jgi:hypothetical protein
MPFRGFFALFVVRCADIFFFAQREIFIIFAVEFEKLLSTSTKRKKGAFFYSNYFTNRLFFGILTGVVKLSYPCLHRKQLKKGVVCI